jgi:AmiR/NasT family two-component response regulator
MSVSPLTVVAVSSDALRPELLELLFDHDSSDAVIVVESIARAHARISHLQPALVVLFMEVDDADACQLLSVLQNDRALRGLRVLLCPTEPGRAIARSVRDDDNGSDRLTAARC